MINPQILASFSKGLCYPPNIAVEVWGQAAWGPVMLCSTSSLGSRPREVLPSVMSPAITAKEERNMEKLYSLLSVLI